MHVRGSEGIKLAALGTDWGRSFGYLPEPRGEASHSTFITQQELCKPQFDKHAINVCKELLKLWTGPVWRASGIRACNRQALAPSPTYSKLSPIH